MNTQKAIVGDNNRLFMIFILLFIINFVLLKIPKIVINLLFYCISLFLSLRIISRVLKVYPL